MCAISYTKRASSRALVPTAALHTPRGTSPPSCTTPGASLRPSDRRANVCRDAARNQLCRDDVLELALPCIPVAAVACVGHRGLALLVSPETRDWPTHIRQLHPDRTLRLWRLSPLHSSSRVFPLSQLSVNLTGEICLIHNSKPSSCSADQSSVARNPLSVPFVPPSSLDRDRSLMSQLGVCVAPQP